MKIATKTNAGLTLIEMILAIAIMGILTITFIPLFVMSANTNDRSEVTLDATYLGIDVMELVYDLSKTVPYDDLSNKLVNEIGFIQLSGNVYTYEYADDKYLQITFTESGNLIKIVAKIYKDKSMEDIEAQYESLYSWIGRGGLSEE